MNYTRKRIFLLHLWFIFAFTLIFQLTVSAQNVKRVVIIKVDGLPGYFVNHFVGQRDPRTKKSVLPWFEEVFYKNGTRLDNFYTRGMSLSATSWSTLDTGQHLQIKGNVEYDRYSLRAYDYLNIIPYYVNYGLKKRADMPGVEVLDQLNIPLLYDAFPYENRYTSYQLFQRGVEWEVIGGGFLRLFPTAPKDFIDEWTTGFEFNNLTVDQHERDIIGRLDRNPEINYFDYYAVNFDHVSHSSNSTEARLNVLKALDKTVGKIWTAIQKSSRADETALFLVSDHGFNSDDKTFSQGFNLVKLLGGAEGGGHHVITKRRLMLDYSIKGINPFVPLITTTSSDSYYLKGQSADYPTALVDFDGNERSAIHLRNSDLNILQLLLQQLKEKNLAAPLKQSAQNSLFEILDRHRERWQTEINEMDAELQALQRWIDAQQPIVKAPSKKLPPEQIVKGAGQAAVRLAAQVETAERDETAYHEYIRVLSNLVNLKPENFDAAKIKIEDYISKGSMGDQNSVYQLQNYVVGLSEQGLTPAADGKIDLEKSFKRVNYFSLLESQTVKNNVQPKVGNQPIDFIAAGISPDLLPETLAADLKSDEDVIWLYGGEDKQALIFTRRDENGGQSFRYLPVADLRQTADGKISFAVKNWAAGFPLKIFEDENLDVAADKNSWLGSWHTEAEWFEATYKTLYSNAVIGLNEQLDAHPLTGHQSEGKDLTADERLIHRLRLRQRRLTVTDLLLFAGSHWNFDVRGFNPGGNHGAFFRVSTNSTLMAAGGLKTGIPRGLTIEKPYDNMSFVPTVLALLGDVNDQGEPNRELYRLGFRRFPGRIIRELIAPPSVKVSQSSGK